MEGDPRGRLLLAEEGRRLHLGVAEAQVLVEVVQAIDKVAYMTSEHLNIKVNYEIRELFKYVEKTQTNRLQTFS